MTPPLRYNQFGGTVGGPVWIPKIYNGHNRTFFYGGYEQWLYSAPSIMRATLPNAQERVGDFSNTRDSNGALIGVYDPATTQVNPKGNGYVRSVLPGNKVPTSRMDPVALNVLKYVPLPNVPAADPYTDTNNWLFLGNSPTKESTFNIKLDHRFSDADSTFVRFTDTKQTRVGSGYGLGVADSYSLARTDHRNRYNTALSETHIFTPNLINEFRANALLFRLDFSNPSYGQGWPQKLGMPSTTPPDSFPTESITGFLTIGPNNTSVGIQNEQTTQFFNAVTWVNGRHTVKFGMEQRFVQVNFIKTNYPSGQYSFSNSLTGDPQKASGTGYGMATYLLGAVSSAQINIEPAFSFQNWSNSSFVQDDWKVTPRLTLNLGLRYDLRSPPVERWNRFSNFDPYSINPQTHLPGALEYAGSTAPRNIVHWDANNFGPRAGFAFAVTPKFVVRGAYGIVYVPTEAGDTNADSANALGFEGVNSYANSNANYPAFQFSGGIPPFSQPLGSAGGPSAFRGQNVRYQEPNAPTPYLQQWNLTLQQQIKGGWVLTGSYTGNHGVKLFGLNYDLNQIDPSYYALGTQLQNTVPNPFFGQIASGTLSGKTITLAQSLVPYPDYLQVGTWANHGSSSSYNAFQATAEKRFSGGSVPSSPIRTAN